jgi:hypothetical protein
VLVFGEFGGVNLKLFELFGELGGGWYLII